MRTVHVAGRFTVSVPDAEAHWYDTTRWPEWVDGLERIIAVQGDWPAEGGVVMWQSGPAGRGRVLERVVQYEPRRGQTVEVADGSIDGHQSIVFVAEAPGVEVQLSLAYAIRRRTPVTALVDFLFIRRAMTASLQQTLSRFGASLEAAYPVAAP